MTDDVRIVSDEYRMQQGRPKSPERLALEDGKTIFVTDHKKMLSISGSFGYKHSSFRLVRRQTEIDGEKGWVLWTLPRVK